MRAWAGRFSAWVSLLVIASSFGALVAVLPGAQGAVIWADNLDPPIPGWTSSGIWHPAIAGPDFCYGNTTSNHPAAADTGNTAWAYHADTVPPALPGFDCSYNLGAFVPVAHMGTIGTPPGAITLPPLGESWLHFSTWRETEGGGLRDTMRVLVAAGGPPVPVFQLLDAVGPQFFWERIHVNLTAFAGSSVRILWEFDTVTASANGFAGWYVDSVLVDDVVPAGGTLTVTPSDIAPATAAQGETDVEVIQLDTSVSAGTVTLASLTVDLTGTGADTDIAAVRLWADDGDATFDPLADTLLDTGQVGLGSATLFPGWALFALAPQSLFLSYDISGGATVGAIVGMRIVDSARFIPYPPDTITCSGCPINTFDGVKTRITAGFGGDLVTFTPSDLAPLTAAQGQPAVLMGRIDVTVSANTATVQAVRLNLTGFPPADADVAAVRIWQDDYDSVYEPLADLLVGTGTFTFGMAAIPLVPAVLVSAGLDEVLWIGYDIDVLAGVGQYVGLYMDGGALAIAPPDTSACSGCPVDTYTAGVDTRITGLPDILAATPSDIAPITVDTGTADVPMMQVNLSVNANDATLDTVTVTRTGTGTDSDVDRMDLWQDDGDGLPNAGDAYLGSGTLAGGDAVLPAAVTVTAGTPVILFVSFDIAAGATPGTYVGAMIDAATDFAVAAPDLGLCPACPVDTYGALTKTLLTAPPNAFPEAGSLTVEGFAAATPGILHIMPATPLFAWAYNDPDGDPQSDYEVQVGTLSGANDMWAPGPAGSPALGTTYGGLALADGATYYFQVRVNDGASGWSGFNETPFRMNTAPPVPTTPIAPANGAPVVSSGTQTVTWTSGGFEAEGDTVTYFWEVDLDALFTPPIYYSGNGVPTTSGTFATVALTQYWWRVQTWDGYEYSAWSPAWTFTTNGAPVASGLGVSGPDILHILSPTPLFNWTYSDPEGTPQVDFEVEVGTAPTLNDVWSYYPMGSSANSVTYGGGPLLDGMDYWFAVRVNDGLEWGGWAEVMFHMNGVPPPPTSPVTPGDGTTVTASASQTVSWTSGGADPDAGDTVTFHWDVASDAAFTNVLYSGDTTTLQSNTFATAPLTDYYWRVSATDTYETSAYGNGVTGYWWFNTSAAVNDPPEARTLTINGAAAGSSGALHVLGSAPLFAWTYYDSADPHTDSQVRVGSTLAGTDLWAPAASGSPTASATYAGSALLRGTDYYLGVRVHDGTQWSGWNDTMFHMNNFPPAPTTPVVPANGTTIGASGTQTVSWAPVVDDELDLVTYQFQVSSNAAFTLIVHAGSSTATTSTSFVTTSGSTYYWRVLGDDGLENGPYGNLPTGYWWFNTSGVNTPPVASFPGVGGFLDGSPGILHILAGAPDLNWSYSDADSDAQAQYQVRVGTASGLNDTWAPAAFGGSAGNATYSGPALVDGTNYWFGINVSDGADWSGWVEVMFRMNTLPPAPTLNTPADGLTGVAAAVSLTWTTVTDAETDAIQYAWELSLSATFATLVDSGTVSGTSASPVTLAAGTQHFWRVRANDGWEDGAFSAVFDFTTAGTTGGQTGTITVTVSNATGPVVGADVETVHPTLGFIGGTTDANGQFTFTNLPYGNYTVRASASGHEDETRTVTLASASQSVTLTLTETTTGPQPTPDYTWLVILLIIVVAMALLLLFLRKKKKPEEEPAGMGQPPAEGAPPEAKRAEPPAGESPRAEEELPPSATEPAPVKKE